MLVKMLICDFSSDERYKDNVTPIENPNDKIKQIGGYTFDWNDKHEVFKGQHDVGVIDTRNRKSIIRNCRNKRKWI